MSATQPETAVVPVETEYQRKLRMVAAPGAKFNEERRTKYLAERQKGTPHYIACRRAGVSPTTVERYRTAAGPAWGEAVRLAHEEGLDPIRAVRRAAAMEGEPWAVRAEIGDGRVARPEGGASGGTVNIGTVVVGGEAGVAGALGQLLDRLRERELTTGADVDAG